MRTRHALIPLCMAAFMSAPAHAEYCREFTSVVYVGGRLQEAYGTSCRQPDGAWKIAQQPTIKPIPYSFVQPVTYVQQPVRYYSSYSSFGAPSYYPNPSFFSISYVNRDRWHRPHYNRGHGRHRGHH